MVDEFVSRFGPDEESPRNQNAWGTSEWDQIVEFLYHPNIDEIINTYFK